MQANRELLDHNASAHDVAAVSYDARHAEIYNSLEQSRLTRVVADVVALAGMPSPEMLDVGAGTGNLALKFLAAGCRVCAADVSPRSLEVLEAKAAAGSRLRTALITDERLPFPDASFDIVGTYSVLHHIPDYLLGVREMLRVLRPGGLLYIDHEASEQAWSPDPILQEYRRHTRLGLVEHVLHLLRTGEAFTPAFAKTVFMKAFVNRRYEREGDIHVWPDDHVEWEKIGAILAQAGASVLRSDAYLAYVPRGGLALYERFKDRCADMRLLVARKP